MAGAGAGTSRVFTHVSEDNPLEQIKDTPGGGRPIGYGKPAGFWLAPGLSWIDLIASRKSWEIAGPIVAEADPSYRFEFTKDFYDSVFRGAPVEDYVSGTPLRPISLSSPKGGTTHFVYQFTIDASKFSTDINAPRRDGIYTITASNVAEFLSTVDRIHADVKANRANYPEGTGYNVFRDATGNARIGWFHQTYMADRWAGVYFDESLFTPELKKTHQWIDLSELPSLCLWHPVSFFDLPRKEVPNPNYEYEMANLAYWRMSRGPTWEPPKTFSYGMPRDDDLKAVLTVVGTPEALKEKLQKGNPYTRFPLPPLKPYLGKLWVAGVTQESPRLVMIMRNGKFVGDAETTFGEATKGGRRRRGRTFRRKPMRRNKNGGRPTRKSKPRRHK